MLPNSEAAVVDLGKLFNYCLNPEHPKGGHKARVFSSVLGLTQQNGLYLQQALLDAAQRHEAIPKLADEHGERFEVRFLLTGPNGNTAEVISGWIVDAGETFPRLISCYLEV